MEVAKAPATYTQSSLEVYQIPDPDWMHYLNKWRQNQINRELATNFICHNLSLARRQDHPMLSGGASVPRG